MKNLLLHSRIIESIVDGSSQIRIPIERDVEIEHLSLAGNKYVNITIKADKNVMDSKDSKIGFFDTEEKAFDFYINQYSLCSIGDEVCVKEEYKLGYIDTEKKEFALDYRVGFDDSMKKPLPGLFKYLSGKAFDYLKRINYKIEENGTYNWEKYKSPLEWYSAKDMPFAFSRFKYKIIGLKVKKVQDSINFEDIEKLGLPKCFREKEDATLAAIYKWFEEFWNDYTDEENIYSKNKYVLIYDLEQIY